MDGVNYAGFNPDLITVASSQTATIFDSKTGKANLSTAQWKISFELFNRILAIPGNRELNNASGLNDFRKVKNLAIYPGKPITGSASAVGLILTAPGKNKESAFNVIETVTSNERELELSKNCGYPAVNTPEVMNQFCADDAFLKTKKPQSILKFQPNWSKYPIHERW